MDSAFHIFQQRLNRFISRYYKIQLYKGSILFILLFLVLFLSITTFEYFLWSSSNLRLFLFFFGIFSSLFIFLLFIAIPLLRFFKLLPQITNKHAISIINRAFPENRDLLINILELEAQDNKENRSLVIASINQKIKNSGAIDFEKSISFKNYKYFFIYLFGILCIYGFVAIKEPKLIKDGFTRIIHYNNHYYKDVGFDVEIDETKLFIEKGSSLIVHIDVVGEKLPTELYIKYGGNLFLLNKLNDNLYSYEFRSVNNNFYFTIQNDYYKSKNYAIEVVKLPLIKSFEVAIEYPEYISEKEQIQENILSFSVPFGSKLKWSFNTEDVDSLFFFSDSNKIVSVKENEQFFFEYEITGDFTYQLVGKNTNVEKNIFGNNVIGCIHDLYPTIDIQYLIDSNNFNMYYFKGVVTDDYGFERLNFVVSKNLNDSFIFLPISKNITKQEFYFQYDYSNSNETDLVSYFIIYDNDELHNYKSQKSDLVTYNKISVQQLMEDQKKLVENMERKMNQAKDKLDDLLGDIEKMKRRMINEKLTGFEKRQLFESINKKQEEILSLLQQVQKDNQLKSNQFSNFEKNNDLIKKQDEIQQMLDRLMDEDLKNLLKELSELSEKYNSDENQKNISDFEKEFKNFEYQLERNFQFLKKMEIEKNLEKVISDLRNIEKEQHEISEKGFKNNVDSLNKSSIDQMNKVIKDFIDAEDKNQTLENPMNIPEINEELNKLSDDIQNNSPEKSDDTNFKKKAEQNEKKANQLANMIEDALKEGDQNQMMEDADNIRQIVENLIYFSYEQEKLIYNEKNFNIVDQSNLLEKFALINDSLLTVGKSSPFLGSYIFKKSNSIETKLLEVKDLIQANKLGRIGVEQRYIIENTNDLILLLGESLKNIESFGSSGSSSNNKKKKSKPSLSDLRKSNESLKNELQNLINKMKEEGKSGKPSNSKEIGKMIAQQEMMQHMLNQISNAAGSQSELRKKLNEIKKLLDENKRDLLDRRINPVLMDRQNKILTRLLEAEKSEMERELDNERISNENKIPISDSLKQKFELDNQIINFDEILNKSTIYLNYFYKTKYQDFLNKLNQSPDEKRN